MVSRDILVRPVDATQVSVEHILIGWKDLAPGYRGGIDPRAMARDLEAARALTRQIVAHARAGEPFEQLMRTYSEDQGTAKSGGAYDVRADGMYAPEFQALALRLHVGEVGVCKTTYGFHVMKRLR